MDYASNIFVDGMLSFGATNVASLRVTGRAAISGRINQPSEAPAQITADVDDWQLAANNAQRGVVVADADDNWNITGIDSSFGRSQDGERITLINTSAFVAHLDQSRCRQSGRESFHHSRWKQLRLRTRCIL